MVLIGMILLLFGIHIGYSLYDNNTKVARNDITLSKLTNGNVTSFEKGLKYCGLTTNPKQGYCPYDDMYFFDASDIKKPDYQGQPEDVARRSKESSLAVLREGSRGKYRYTLFRYGVKYMYIMPDGSIINIEDGKETDHLSYDKIKLIYNIGEE